MITTNDRDKAVSLIQCRPSWLKLKKIAEDTTIPEGWLKMFSRNKIKDPSVNRVETIRNYLTNLNAKG